MRSYVVLNSRMVVNDKSKYIYYIYICIILTFPKKGLIKLLKILVQATGLYAEIQILILQIGEKIYKKKRCLTAPIGKLFDYENK